MEKISKMAWIIGLMALATAWTTAWAEEAAVLAKDGAAQAVIVLPETPSVIDDYAAQTLQGYLAEMIGDELIQLPANDLQPDQTAIFVGLSDAARDRLGDVFAPLAHGTYVVRSTGGDLYLYGEDKHGSLWAVMSLLEKDLGWRWFSPLEEPVVPFHPSLSIPPLVRTGSFSFNYRQMQTLFEPDWYYQQGLNMGWQTKDRPPAYRSAIPTTKFTHTLTAYIPPTPDDRYANDFAWQDKQTYFAEHPEWFTLSERGERIPNKQLCLSNDALRAELYRNVLRDIDHARDRGWQVPMYITLTAADTGGRFCWCDGCVALEERYHSPGGPLIDAAIQVAEKLQDDRPGVLVKMSAYRRSQTQDPPILPGRQMLPANIIVSFAPIEDQYFADWWHHRDPMIQDTYQDLLGWSRLTHNLLAWIYPDGWGSGLYMPVGNVQRVVTQLRLMHVAGVRWFFADHPHILWRCGFAELQRYLMVQLLKDIDCDTDAVIREFTDHHYGAAGARMRHYLMELEQGRIDMDLPPGIGDVSYGVSYKSRDYDARTFPYLTAENVHRWQGWFDEMEARTAHQPRALLHVQAERRELDLATLARWFELREAYPHHYQDPQRHADRIQATDRKLKADNRWVKAIDRSVIEQFLFSISAGQIEPPIPDVLSDVPPERLRQFVPIRHRGEPKTVADPAAAFGYAVPVDQPSYPFSLAFYMIDRGRSGARLQVPNEQIVPGEYRLYELGEIEITPDCRIDFHASCQTHLQLGALLYEPGAGNRWRAYASLKFSGSRYGGEGDDYQVLVDRVILVALSKGQFAP